MRCVKLLVHIYNYTSHEDKIIDFFLEFRICQLVNETNAIYETIFWFTADDWFYDLFLPTFAKTQNGQRQNWFCHICLNYTQTFRLIERLTCFEVFPLCLLCAPKRLKWLFLSINTKRISIKLFVSQLEKHVDL